MCIYIIQYIIYNDIYIIYNMYIYIYYYIVYIDLMMIHNGQYVSGDSDHLIPVDLDMSVPKKWDCSKKTHLIA